MCVRMDIGLALTRVRAVRTAQLGAAVCCLQISEAVTVVQTVVGGLHTYSTQTACLLRTLSTLTLPSMKSQFHYTSCPVPLTAMLTKPPSRLHNALPALTIVLARGRTRARELPRELTQNAHLEASTGFQFITPAGSSLLAVLVISDTAVTLVTI